MQPHQNKHHIFNDRWVFLYYWNFSSYDKKRRRHAAAVYNGVARLRFDNAPSFLLFWPFMHQKSILLPSSADW